MTWTFDPVIRGGPDVAEPEPHSRCSGADRDADCGTPTPALTSSPTAISRSVARRLRSRTTSALRPRLPDRRCRRRLGVAGDGRYGPCPPRREPRRCRSWRRKHCDAPGSEPPATGAVTPGLPGTSEPVHLLRPVERGREPTGPVSRCLVVGHVHDSEAAEVLLGLGSYVLPDRYRACAMYTRSPTSTMTATT
jgi:hypothetical protein